MAVFLKAKSKLFIGDKKVKKGYLGNTKVYSAGNIVTYVVDSGVSYQEEVDSDATCLSPTTFVPEKEGYTFLGWREDDTASSEILTECVMGDEPITLYAVFSKEIILSYNGNSSTSGSTDSQTGYQYYNNGNVTDATFTLSSNGFTRTNYSFSKWAMGSTSGTQYAAGSTISLSDNTTFYAVWIQSTYSSPTLANVSTSLYTSNESSGSYNYSGNTLTASWGKAKYPGCDATIRCGSYDLTGFTKAVISVTHSSSTHDGSNRSCTVSATVGGVTSSTISTADNTSTITVYFSNQTSSYVTFNLHMGISSCNSGDSGSFTLTFKVNSIVFS